MNTTTTSVSGTTTVAKLAKAYRAWRAERAVERRLAQELAQYRTPAELNDLYAALDRSDPVESARVRRILDRTLV